MFYSHLMRKNNVIVWRNGRLEQKGRPENRTGKCCSCDRRMDWYDTKWIRGEEIKCVWCAAPDDVMQFNNWEVWSDG